MMVKWLNRAMNDFWQSLDDSDLFIKMVQKIDLEPSAATAYYLGTIKDKLGKSSEAIA